MAAQTASASLARQSSGCFACTMGLMLQKLEGLRHDIVAVHNSHHARALFEPPSAALAAETNRMLMVRLEVKGLRLRLIWLCFGVCLE